WTAISYTITYNLDGGTVATANPTSYTVETETFTLNNPTKNGSKFAGWTGTGLNQATMTVEIAKGSTGDREYTATWTGGGSTPDPDAPVFRGQTLILGGQIGVIFYVDIPETYRNPNDCWMEFEVSGDEFSTSDRRPQSYNEDDYIAGPSGENCYKFTCYINSVQMADNIKAVLHYGNESDTVEYEYTAQTYLDTVINSTGGYVNDAVELAKAIKDFGSYVQPVLAQENHWNYGVDHVSMNAVNNYSTNDFNNVKTAVSGYALNFKEADSTAAGIEKVGNTLQLESKTTIIVYLAPSTSYKGKVYVKVDNGTEGEADYSSENSYYIVQIKDISPHELADSHTITVRTDNGTFEIKVFALSYVNSVLTSTIYADNTAIKNAVTSLYNYYDKTVTYRSNRPDEYGNNN
ncbi:MAG: InlB B-repeat-containing protein, partial [Synergistaceae bacterium]|nr:InlB B-repeat-containing protein [Synergistaceae bacterium]